MSVGPQVNIYHKILLITTLTHLKWSTPNNSNPGFDSDSAAVVNFTDGEKHNKIMHMKKQYQHKWEWKEGHWHEKLTKKYVGTYIKTRPGKSLYGQILVHYNFLKNCFIRLIQG